MAQQLLDVYYILCFGEMGACCFGCDVLWGQSGELFTILAPISFPFHVLVWLFLFASENVAGFACPVVVVSYGDVVFVLV